MKKQITCALFVVLALGVFSFLSPLARAEWEQLSETGSWEVCERDHWKENLADTVGFAEWGNKTVSAFTGYYATFEFTQLTTGAPGFWLWDSYSTTAINVWLNFTGAGGKREVLNLEFTKQIWLWSVLGRTAVFSRVRENPSVYFESESGTIGSGMDDFNVMGYTEVFVYQQESDHNNLVIKVFNYQKPMGSSPNAPRKITEVVVNVGEAWFASVSMNVAVRHLGCHPTDFEGFLTNEAFDYVEGSFPAEETVVTSMWDALVESLYNSVAVVLPREVKDAVGSFQGWIPWLWDLSNLFVVALSTVLPLLPFILLFYGLDACITSVVTGSFEPVGAVVMSMYGLASSFVSAVVAVIGTIYDFIHFW